MGRRIVNIALLGAGAMGRCHAETIACHLRDARLAAIADPAEAHARQAALLGDNPLVADTASDTPAPGYLESCGGVFLDTAIHDYDSVRILSGSEPVRV